MRTVMVRHNANGDEDKETMGVENGGRKAARNMPGQNVKWGVKTEVWASNVKGLWGLTLAAVIQKGLWRTYYDWSKQYGKIFKVGPRPSLYCHWMTPGLQYLQRCLNKLIVPAH